MKEFPRELSQSFSQTMCLDPTRLLLSFKVCPSPEELASLLKRFDFILEDASNGNHEGMAWGIEKVNHTQNRFWVQSTSKDPIEQRCLAKLDEEFRSIIEWIGPVYRLEGSRSRKDLFCPSPNTLLIKPFARLNETGKKMLSEIIIKYALCESMEESGSIEGYRYYTVNDSRTHSSYRLKTILEHLSEVRFDNIPMITTAVVTVNTHRSFNGHRIRPFNRELSGTILLNHVLASPDEQLVESDPALDCILFDYARRAQIPEERFFDNSLELVAEIFKGSRSLQPCY